MSARTDAIDAAHTLVWRNLPTWPSTFSPCACRREAGRGGGKCLRCAEEELAKLVGPERAADYVATCKRVRELEREHKNGGIND